MTIYVLNRNLELLGQVDEYKSLIWATRYWNVGDCELYVPASSAAVPLLRLGNFLCRSDSDSVFQIRKITVTTDAENGDYYAAYGVDVKTFLDQRVFLSTEQVDGNAEDFIREQVDAALGSNADDSRKITDLDGNLIFGLDAAAGFTETLTEQVAFQNLGERVRAWCKCYGWGYRVRLDDVGFKFSLFRGADRTDTVIFADRYQNLITTKYVDDETKLTNVAVIGGEGEGTARRRTEIGVGASTERFEKYVDAKNATRKIKFSELVKAYPLSGTQGYIHNGEYFVRKLDIRVFDAPQLARLETDYPDGTVVTVDGETYYRLEQVAIASLPSDTPAADDTVMLYNVIYDSLLWQRGEDALAGEKKKTTFDGKIEPRMTFLFGRDYFLGDIVTIESKYGVSVGARITEIVEVDDEKGYSVEPKYEYIVN